MKQEKPWWEARNYQFIKLPMALMQDSKNKSLSTASKLLYALMLDRMSLSEANGWADSDGETFIYYSVREACQRLSCGHDKVTRAMRELENAGLLHRERQGQGKPDRLYVLPFSAECDIPADKDSDSAQPGKLETSIPESAKPAPNQTDHNQTEKSYIDPSIYPEDRDAMIERVKEQIEFDILIEQNEKGKVDEIVLLIVDTLRNPSPTIRIGGIERPRQEVRNRLRSLDRFYIEYVLLAMRRCASEVRNIRAYLLTALYYAPETMDSYFDALVNHDMPELFRRGA